MNHKEDMDEAEANANSRRNKQSRVRSGYLSLSASPHGLNTVFRTTIFDRGQDLSQETPFSRPHLIPRLHQLHSFF